MLTRRYFLALLQGLVFIKFRTAPSPIGFEVNSTPGDFDAAHAPIAFDWRKAHVNLETSRGWLQD